MITKNSLGQIAPRRSPVPEVLPRIIIAVAAALTSALGHPAPSNADPCPHYPDAEFYEAGLSPARTVVGDLDGDGDRDLAVANLTSNDVSVLLNDGDGTFAGSATYPAWIYPYDLAIGDLDGDRDLDLVVVSADYGGGGEEGPSQHYVYNDVSILLNVGDGSFAAPILYDFDEYYSKLPFGVAIGDLNGDRANDVVLVNSRFNTVSVLLNNGIGDGSFAAPVPYGVGEDPQSVAIGDLDGDGDRDLAVANLSTDDVSILTNLGDGTFAEHVTYDGVGDGPVSVAIGDLDGDGDQDFAVAHRHSDNVSVRLNAGNGIFGQFYFAVGDRPREMAAEDLDRDGDLDLGVLIRDGVSILENKGNGGFEPYVEYEQPVWASSLVMADLDGDGLRDLALGGGADSVQVRFNQCAAPVTPEAAEASGPTALRLGITPNPFTTEATVRFALDAPGDASVDVFDASGRRVRRLASGVRTAGLHALRWNGRDDAGSRVTSGMYWIRIATDRRLVVERVSILR